MKPPKAFTGGGGEQLREFETDYRGYVTYERQGRASAAELIPFYLEGQAKECYNNLDKGERGDLDKIFERLRDRFCPPSFRLIIGEKICSEKQKEGESVDTYISRYDKLVQLTKLPDEAKKSQFISNLLPIIKSDVMLFNPPNLAEAYARARVKEAAENLGGGLT